MKIVKIWLLLASILLASDGKILFEKHCISCHTPFIPMSQIKENFLDSNNTQLNLKAPTLNQLSYRLKQRVGDPHGDEDLHRMEVTAFMSDYVIHPDRDKSVCLDDVMHFFKTMPSLKGKVSEEELDDIGTYLYDFDSHIVREKGLHFEGFDEALKRAKKEHKIIMIEAMSKECHFCLKMEHEVLVEPDVVAEIEKGFVPVKIDITTHQVPLGLKVDVTPSFIFIDAQKNLLLNIPGAWKKSDFLMLLKEAKIKAKEKK